MADTLQLVCGILKKPLVQEAKYESGKEINALIPLRLYTVV